MFDHECFGGGLNMFIVGAVTGCCGKS
jgi:hypothetical protein